MKTKKEIKARLITLYKDYVAKEDIANNARDNRLYNQTRTEQEEIQREITSLEWVIEESLNVSLRDWYLAHTLNDDFAKKYLRVNSTFFGLYCELLNTKTGSVYKYLFSEGQADSIIREHMFTKLAVMLDVDYSNIYQLWLEGKNQ